MKLLGELQACQDGHTAGATARMRKTIAPKLLQTLWKTLFESGIFRAFASAWPNVRN